MSPLHRLGEWLIDRRLPVTLVAVLLTAVMGSFAVRVRLATQLGDLLPYRHPFIEVHRRYADRFGGANQMTIMVESQSGNVFTVGTLGKIFRLTQELDRLPGVNHDLIDSIGHRTCRYLRQDGGVIMFPPVMWGPPKSAAEADEIRAAAEPQHGRAIVTARARRGDAGIMQDGQNTLARRQIPHDRATCFVAGHETAPVGRERQRRDRSRPDSRLRRHWDSPRGGRCQLR